MDKKQTPKSLTLANTKTEVQAKRTSRTAFQLVDNRPEAKIQRKLQEVARNNPQMTQLKCAQNKSVRDSVAQNNSNDMQGFNFRINQNIASNQSSIQLQTISKDYNGPSGSSQIIIQGGTDKGTDPSGWDPPAWCQPYHPDNPNNEGSHEPHNHQRGHLIGKQFGGQGTKDNIVTLTDKTNHPGMTNHENVWAKKVDNDTSNAFWRYTVTPEFGKWSFKKNYKGKDTKILETGPEEAPSRVKMLLESSLNKTTGYKKEESAIVDNGQI